MSRNVIHEIGLGQLDTVSFTDMDVPSGTELPATRIVDHASKEEFEKMSKAGNSVASPIGTTSTSFVPMANMQFSLTLDHDADILFGLQCQMYSPFVGSGVSWRYTVDGTPVGGEWTFYFEIYTGWTGLFSLGLAKDISAGVKTIDLEWKSETGFSVAAQQNARFMRLLSTYKE